MKIPDFLTKNKVIFATGFVVGLASVGVIDTAGHSVANLFGPKPDPEVMQMLYADARVPLQNPPISIPFEEGQATITPGNPDAEVGPGNMPGAQMPAEPRPGDPTPTYTAGGMMVLERSNHFYPGTKDPIWLLSLKNGDKVVTFQAVVGRATKQHDKVDRLWTAGNKSPLPRGTYTVGQPERIQPGWDPELGGPGAYWISLEPQFKTARSALGIHVDPSIGKNNGESGTSGCIGLINPKENVMLAQLINKLGIRTLKVVS